MRSVMVIACAAERCEIMGPRPLEDGRWKLRTVAAISSTLQHSSAASLLSAGLAPSVPSPYGQRDSRPRDARGRAVSLEAESGVEQ